METWNELTKDERITEWKKFRNKIQSCSVDTQLSEVAEYFAKVPYSSRMIDYYTPDTWPSPWEILHMDSVCENCISLLMYYTLALNDVDATLWLVEDSTDRYIILVSGDQHVLNYELCEISTLHSVKNNFQIIETFDKQCITQYR